VYLSLSGLRTYTTGWDTTRAGTDWEHEHLSDKYKEFKASPHFVVFNPDLG
jgi:hypothetical protein